MIFFHPQSTTCSQDINCLCSSAASTGLYDCLQCALTLQPDQDVLEQAQESYDGALSNPFTYDDRSLTQLLVCRVRRGVRER